MKPVNGPPRQVWQALRRLLNCNTEQLAERLDVDPMQITAWEAGTARPSAEELRTTATALKLALAAAQGADLLAQYF